MALARSFRFFCPENPGKNLGLLDDCTHPADHLINGQRHLMIKNSDVAGVCCDQPEKHSDRGCFARAIGTEEAVDAADRHA
jgi:hypothetical protein